MAGHVSGGQEVARFEGDGETDSFTIDLDSDQTLTAVFSPDDLSILARMESHDPTSSPIAAGQAASVGDAVSLQTISIASAGTYQMVGPEDRLGGRLARPHSRSPSPSQLTPLPPTPPEYHGKSERIL